MSYCRWSSDGFQCDVYVYQSDQGYETHVAARRRPKRIPDLDLTSAATIQESLIVQRAALDDPDNDLQEIGLLEDGASFIHESPGECASNLIRLKNLGYQIPQDVIDALIDEWQEQEGIGS